MISGQWGVITAPGNCPHKPRLVQADLAHADNLQRCLTVFHNIDERLLKVIILVLLEGL